MSPLVRSLQIGLVLGAWCLVVASPASAADPELKYPATMELPADYRAWFKNPDGSCVQCSNGMVGMHLNVPEWTYLLFDTEEYGRAVRGGSWPGRVADYARKRGVPIYNVTGNSFRDTRPWMLWACKTNRFCAIGAGGSHFQTLYGYIPGAEKPWLVCNNNSTYKIDEYTEDGFRRLHEASGAWIVIVDKPATAPPPLVVEWWR